MPRRLGPDEKALWGKVMATVKPLETGRAARQAASLPSNSRHSGEGGNPSPERSVSKQASGKPRLTELGSRLRGNDEKLELGSNLDSHWDRRINRGGIVPDISIDLHDASLSRAYGRLDGALEQAIAQKMKVVLLVTGKPRAHDRASGEGRGAIAAVVRDWLAASRYSRYISAVRNAHPKHGGAGALYIMLKG
jgi:DNA-nicking Smr family endonuclease